LIAREMCRRYAAAPAIPLFVAVGEHTDTLVWPQSLQTARVEGAGEASPTFPAA
jgi:hypothetical protein